MLLLPNGCTCSEPSVFPKNWKTVSASTKHDWRIQYYFEKKLIIVKRMNRFKTVEERRAITKAILQEEIKKLKAGYNPLKNATIAEVQPAVGIEPTMPFIKAIRAAYSKLKLPKPTMACISSSITYIEKAAIKLGYNNMEVQKISRKHVIPLLEECNLSAQSYNHYRAYLMLLFTELIRLQAVEINPVDKYVEKMDVEEDIPELFTLEERRTIKKHFKSNKYFSRFMEIFFHSGARPIEMLRIKKEKVNVDELYYKTKVRKRKKIVEEKRAIKKIVAHLWRKAFNEAKDGEYIFGRFLQPSPIPCPRDYITDLWFREVKVGLGINKNFYWLKHTNLDETSRILDAKAAARQAGHKSTVITLKHYLINEEERQRARLSEVRNKFA